MWRWSLELQSLCLKMLRAESKARPGVQSRALFGRKVMAAVRHWAWALCPEPPCVGHPAGRALSLAVPLALSPQAADQMAQQRF